MHRAITAISLMLLGASILIFVSALLMPLIRTSISEDAGLDTENRGDSVYQEDLEKPDISQIQSQATVDNPISSKRAPATKHEKNTLDAGPAPQSTVTAENAPSLTQNTHNGNQGASNALRSTASQPASSILRPHEIAPAPIPSTDSESQGAHRREAISLLVLEDAFPPGAVTPTTDAAQAIDKIIPEIAARPLDTIIIEGHADTWMPEGISPDQGAQLNRKVSFQRAEAIAMVLKQKGVAGARILVNGLGDAMPLASNLTPQGRSKNRRVEIKISPYTR